MRNTKFYYLFLLFLGLGTMGELTAQNTVGVRTTVDSLLAPGFNLMFPHNQANIYLLDNCGRLVNQWENPSDTRPGISTYLASNGDIVFANRPDNFTADPIWAGGGGMSIERKTWDNSPVWSYSLNDSSARLHHDFSLLANGNVLALAWEYISLADMVAAGRDTSLFTTGEIWPDMILELQPDGNGGATVVWEWHSWDHIVQDHDAGKANFGVVGDHPELINVNYDDFSGTEADWHHMNALDYNATLDQIIVSVPSFNEVWIIDHSTTTVQAASSTGGNAGMGGDLIYRWGNPLAYDQGDSTDIQLWFQHDIHWIDDHLSGTEPDFGKLGVFNNRVGADFSSANIFAPVWDPLTSTYEKSGNTFLPTGFDWSYTTTPPQDMWSTGLSSVQRLPNGNTLICIGRAGRTIEVTPSGQIVWDYIQPLVQGNPVSQGDTIVFNTNISFRMKRYPPTFSGFAGRTIVSGDYLEQDPDTTLCALPMVGTTDLTKRSIRLYPNPTTGTVYLARETGQKALVEVFDLLGQQVRRTDITGFNPKLDLSDLNPGIYFIRVDKATVGKVMLQD